MKPVYFFAYGIFRQPHLQEGLTLSVTNCHTPGAMYMRGGIAHCRFFETYAEDDSRVVGDLLVVTDQNRWRNICATESGMYVPVMVPVFTDNYNVLQPEHGWAIAWHSVMPLDQMHEHVINGDYLNPEYGTDLGKKKRRTHQA